jgi:opacity protein-like surface antigen
LEHVKAFHEENAMRSKTLVLAAGSMVALAATVLAADVTGKWTAQVPGRGGQTRETTFNFKAEGEKLTGTMSGRQGDVNISDGKIKGDELSFNVALSFQGNDVKFLYKGKLADDEIKFTRQSEGSDQTAEFTAKRAK